MNKYFALKMLEDLNMCLESEEIEEEYFLNVLKNYIEVKE